MWLIDNLPQYYYGKSLVTQMALIKASDKYKLEDLLQFGEKPNKKGRVQTPYFIKYGNVWKFSGFDRKMRNNLMSQTWNAIKEMYV